MTATTNTQMSRTLYRYSFGPAVEINQAQDSLLLAVLAAEGVHGQAQVRMDGAFLLEEATRACVVDATTPVGETIARIFTRFLAREFGEDAFTVERVGGGERIDRPTIPTNGRSVR